MTGLDQLSFILFDRQNCFVRVFPSGLDLGDNENYSSPLSLDEAPYLSSTL